MILKKIRNIVRWVVVLFFSTTILAVVAYRFIPVYVTPLMIIRCFQQVADGESITLHHHWVSMDKISPHMPVAVMASEDARFLKHHGFDFNAIESAAKNNARGGKVHGASTISQQTAKNVFLWPGRSWTRKGASSASWRSISTVLRWDRVSMVSMRWLSIISTRKRRTSSVASVP